jgi:hypothetical protein
MAPSCAVCADASKAIVNSAAASTREIFVIGKQVSSPENTVRV